MKTKISLIMPVYNQEELVKRALASIPLDTPQMEIIIVDDGSTDNSFDAIMDWADLHPNKRIRVIRFSENRGVAAAMNRAFDSAHGEYIVSLSSDDYYITNFDRFMPLLDGKNDLIYFDLQINNGEIWHLDEESKQKYVGAVKIIRREFLGDTRIPDMKWDEDVPFSQALYAKNPKEVFTGIVLKHYNWPREGSLNWQATHQ